jgi:hypothetical protein
VTDGSLPFLKTVIKKTRFHFIICDLVGSAVLLGLRATDTKADDRRLHKGSKTMKSTTTIATASGFKAKLFMSITCRAATPLSVLFMPLLVIAATVIPTARAAGECFQETRELRAAVEEYVATNKSETSDVAIRYGWPIGTWCVGNLTSFEMVLANVRLNHDISDWVRVYNTRDVNDYYIFPNSV